MRANREYLRDKFHRDGYCVIENIVDPHLLSASIPEIIAWWLDYYPSDTPEVVGSVVVDETFSYRSFIDYTHIRSRELGTNGTALAYAFLRTHDSDENPRTDDPIRDLLRSQFEDISYITGQEVTGFYESFLSKYEQGCFLSTHSDEFESPSPNLAFVLGLTGGWCNHWGGLTIIEGKDPLAATALFPNFNSLVVFKIPVWHMVSEVNNAAPYSRLAFSGWFYSAKGMPHLPQSFWNVP